MKLVVPPSAGLDGLLCCLLFSLLRFLLLSWLGSGSFDLVLSYLFLGLHPNLLFVRWGSAPDSPSVSNEIQVR
eukprot:m.331978 g.331978  ORF g.331978 m.331978 type:complete len:73 (-) comp55630_c0_seq2:9-227(-)